MAKTTTSGKTVEALKHDEATRRNIPTAEFQSVLKKTEQDPVRVAYERRNRDLDPQLVWRGKDEQDWSDLVDHALPFYIQEKVHPKALIDDLLRSSKERRHDVGDAEQRYLAGVRQAEIGTDCGEGYQPPRRRSHESISGVACGALAAPGFR